MQQWPGLACIVQAYKCTLELVWRGADEIGAIREGLEMIGKGSACVYHDCVVIREVLQNMTTDKAKNNLMHFDLPNSNCSFKH